VFPARIGPPYHSLTARIRRTSTGFDVCIPPTYNRILGTQSGTPARRLPPNDPFCKGV
jgi:hypothetical protein